VKRFLMEQALNFNTNRTARIFTDNNDLIIQQGEDDKDIIFKCDDGSGGLAEYFRLDGSVGMTVFPDAKKLSFGNSFDLKLEHDGSNSYLSHEGTGNLIVRNTTDDGDIIFQSDNGSGGVQTYLTIDGSLEAVVVPDTIYLAAGSGLDLSLVHNGTNSTIQNNTGDLYIKNTANDKDIVFQSDDGSGGLATYLTIDGSNGYIRLEDDRRLTIGSGNDLQLKHSSGASSITNFTGEFNIVQEMVDGDIIFSSDDGSGGVAEYFRVDGGSEKTIYTKPISLLDSVGLQLGTGTDAQIYHTGSEGTFINYTGNFRFIQSADNADLSFYSDDGSGGTAEYFMLDGSLADGSNYYTKWPDNSIASFGSAPDLLSRWL
jgi:hypothetical protein